MAPCMSKRFQHAFCSIIGTRKASLRFARKPDNAWNRRNLESQRKTGWFYQVFPRLQRVAALTTLRAMGRSAVATLPEAGVVAVQIPWRCIEGLAIPCA